MKRSPLFAVASVIALAAVLGSAALAAPKPAATAAPKDSCAKKPSKWARVQCEDFTHSAPGDEYFGRMKLSYLGINNTFHDETIRAGDYTTDPGIVSKVGFADEALRDWSHKYPGDPQLARSYFLAIRMYKKIYLLPWQQKAWTYMHILTSRFPNTYFGKLERADLARGFTEHYFANPQLCPTPLPSGVMPETTPNATQTPSPKPGSPAIDVITPQCVEPSPVPTAGS
ncbi:MAG TPA: hypothetical protein VMA98_02120 [Candidatus Acidoferrales bacterium]|nr:hypothetical protein [Candidatus Acidoferrales bacterium]